MSDDYDWWDNGSGSENAKRQARRFERESLIEEQKRRTREHDQQIRRRQKELDQKLEMGDCLLKQISINRQLKQKIKSLQQKLRKKE